MDVVWDPVPGNRPLRGRGRRRNVCDGIRETEGTAGRVALGGGTQEVGGRQVGGRSIACKCLRRERRNEWKYGNRLA